MWKFKLLWTGFQLLVMFAVLASNVHWQWTPNGYLAGLIAFGVAYVLTWLICRLFDLWVRRKQHLSY